MNQEVSDFSITLDSLTELVPFQSSSVEQFRVSLPLQLLAQDMEFTCQLKISKKLLVEVKVKDKKVF
jgi:hypothetical protein